MPYNKYGNLAPGRPGDCYGSSRRADVSGLIAGGQAAQTSTVVFTAQNNTTYKLPINGVEFELTSDADATKSEIASGFAALIAADQVIGEAILNASAPGDDLILVAKQIAIEFDVDDSDANIAVTTVAAQAAKPIEFGVLVIQEFNASGEPVIRPVTDADASGGTMDVTKRLGVTMREDTIDPSHSGGVDGYGPNDNASCRTAGGILVRTEEKLTTGTLFVRTSDTDTRGYFSSSAGAGRNEVPNARLIRAFSTDLAIIELF